MWMYSPIGWINDFDMTKYITIKSTDHTDLIFVNEPIHTNCPNCGAIMESNHCEYCGSNF